MATRYQEAERGVIRLDDGALIVPELRKEWADYLSWVGKGNDPLPFVKPIIPLETRRAEMIARVNGQRNRVLNRLTADQDGFTWDADTHSTANLTAIAVKVLAGFVLPPDFTWRTSDNQMVSMNAARLNRVLSAIVAKRETVMRYSFKLKDQDIATSATPEAVDLAAGWPI